MTHDKCGDEGCVADPSEPECGWGRPVNTPKELSYDWDLIWDIKTEDKARAKYARLKAALAKIPDDLAVMEKLAIKDGFSLE